MKISPFLFRQIHKWVGLILGLQFLLWTVSGLGMALLDHEEVSGGPRPPQAAAPPMPATAGWATALQSLGSQSLIGLSVRPLLDRQIFEVVTADGVRLFDAETGDPVLVDSILATRIAAAAYEGHGRVKQVAPLEELTLAVRRHDLPIWQVDFFDDRNSSFYISGQSGTLLERRNDSWRLWDFLWMLHNMDYVNRTSFNHPLIVLVAFFTLWLAITGFYLLFTTRWRRDLAWLKRPATRR
jgi:uncharacterized iron-regulated membrane protein